MSRPIKLVSALLLVAALGSACAAPATEAPATVAPATDPPATEVPATEAPATEAPPTEAPATEAPAPTSEPEAEQSEEPPAQIAVYISPDPLGVALEKAFEAEHGDVLTIVGGPWCRKLKSEQEAGDIQADVIYGAEPIFFRALAESGNLLAYTSPASSDLEPEFQWDNGYYVPADLRYVGIVYNKTLVDAADLPASFAGLNDGQWANLTTVPDATQCASALAIAAGLAQPNVDMSFFEGAKANGALLADRAGKLPELVASGEATLGIGPHDPVLRLQNKAKKEGAESPVDIQWAEEGTYVIPRPIAIIADEGRAEAATEIAQALVDFVLSPEGQALAVKTGGYVPVRAGVEGPAKVPADVTLLQVDWDWAAQNSQEIKAAFQEIMYGG